jgi:hypothetical protein
VLLRRVRLSPFLIATSGRPYNITIGRDLGQVVEIATGIAATDRIIDSPPDGLSDGDPVRVVDTKKAAAR